MAIEADLKFLPGLVASATSLATKQYHFVKAASTAGQVKVVAAATDTPYGVLQNDPAATEEASVAYGGISKVVAGTSVGWAETSFVGWNTTGRAVPVAANSTTVNTLVMGKFHQFLGQTTTVTAGQVISVILFPAPERIG